MIDETNDRLEAYRKKRDPERTLEPFTGGTPGQRRRFVVHQHAARNLHWDLRLEMEGVLRSWAVPKGPSVHAEEKRLAVLVEDHPLAYGDFEGVIPAGNYGAGPVIVWDAGSYRSFKPESIDDQFARGKLELELSGFKLRGRWTLVRMSRKEKEWLLLKKAGAGVADVEAVERYPESVFSGLTVEQLANPEAKLAPVRARLEALGAPLRPVAAPRAGLMLATLAERPFTRKDWIFEIKYDGVRVLGERDGERVVLLGRSGMDVTRRYPEVAEALARLPLGRFLVDGEIIALDPRGEPSFQRLQARMGLTRPRDVARAREIVPVYAVCFDCLDFDGRDLRGLPLLERKAALRTLVPPLGVVRYGDHIEEQGEAFFDAAAEHRLEGIVAKRARGGYVAGRSQDWIKIKCQRRQDFVIVGWTEPQGARGGFGALDVGVYEGDDLVYVSRVGTGFDDRTLASIYRRLQPLERPKPPFVRGTPPGKGHHWVQPELVCEVRFTEWTREGGLRHPAFLGMREDVDPRDCRRERAEDLLAPGDPEGAGEAPDPEREVALSNLDKIYWPAERYTKGDLIAFYDTIAPLMLPYLADRPLTLTRFPDGIDGKSFYQKDAPVFVPQWMRTPPIQGKDAERAIRYFVVNDAAALRYIANLGSIPVHVWGSRVATLERPDWMVLDLDPKGAPFAHVVEMALRLRALLDGIQVPSHIKTSGATGLHILVPMGARYTYEETRTLARLIATIVVQEAPEISTVARAIQARGGKVYVDFGQNGHGQTIAAPFSVRPLPGAPVSCPLDWDEVDERLDPARFTIVTVPDRFRGRSDPLAGVLGPGIDVAAVVARVAKRMEGVSPGAPAPGPPAPPRRRAPRRRESRS